ncbi:MAG: hypothetical protein KC609_07735, partial [Myxococcales bacterium]|nr:hypothetical protein [Myxococcales bacterium]
GHYRGVLTIAALPHGRAVARLSWAGGDLVDRTLQIEGPAPQKAPQPSPQKRESPTWDREPTPLVSEWVLPSPGLRPIRARPLTFVGFTTHVGAGRDAAGDQRRRTLRLAFHGELALLAGRLGLDIDLPWLAIDPGVNSAQRNKFGDLRLGLRTPVLDRRGVVLAVYLRSLFSTGDFGRPRNDQWLEPGLALDWRWRDRLLLNTTQTLAIGLNAENKPLLTWGSTYDAIVRVVRWFSLGTELSLQLGLTGPDNRYVAVAISGLLRFDLGRFRLDLFGGGGLNPEARRRLGEFQLGLAFGLLFGDVR